MQVDGPQRKWGDRERIWMEVVRIDLKNCDLSEDFPQGFGLRYRLEWQKRIHVGDPSMIGTRHK